MERQTREELLDIQYVQELEDDGEAVTLLTSLPPGASTAGVLAAAKGVVGESRRVGTRRLGHQTE